MIFSILLSQMSFAVVIANTAHNLFVGEDEVGRSEQRLELIEKTDQYIQKWSNQYSVGPVTYKETQEEIVSSHSFRPVRTQWRRQSSLGYIERKAAFKFDEGTKKYKISLSTTQFRKKMVVAELDGNEGLVLMGYLPLWIVAQPNIAQPGKYQFNPDLFLEEDGRIVKASVLVEVSSEVSMAPIQVKIKIDQNEVEMRITKKGEIFSVINDMSRVRAEWRSWGGAPTTPAPYGQHYFFTPIKDYKGGFGKEFGTPQGQGIHLKGKQK